jgi:ribonuclease-3
MDSETLRQLQQVLEYPFQNVQILEESLLHSSAADDRVRSNERLEFLGDSILSLVICRTLFERYPDYLEGDLTKIKSRLVSRKTCAKLALELQLPQFMKVGKGMQKSRSMRGSVAAASLEAMIAAIYLDGGMAAAEGFILRLYEPLIAAADSQHHHENFKSILQQHCQQTFNCTPYYDLLDEKGPDHNKCFEIAVVIRHTRYPGAWGVTKKEAEQRAAYHALISLGIISEQASEASDAEAV